MRRLRGERGAGTLESLGVVSIAAILVVALVAAMIGFRYADHVAAAFCRVAAAIEGSSGASCAVAPARTAEDYVPPQPCVVSAQGGENSANISFVVTLEGGETWLVEELGDGSYRLTHQGDAGVSIGVGIGGGATITVDDTVYGGSAQASASVGLGLAGGETFYVDSEDAAMELLTQQRQDSTKDAIVGDSGPVRWVTDQVGGWFGDDQEGENREPDAWFVEGGVYGGGSAELAGGLPGLNGDASAEAALEMYLGTTQKSDGTSTDYLRAEMSADLGISGNGPNAQGYDTFFTAGAGGEMSAVVEIDRDENGEPVAMRVVSAMGGHAESDTAYSQGGLDDDASSVTARTLQIPLETSADRDLAARFLQTTGVPYVPGVTDPSDITSAALTPDAFVQLATDMGEVASTRGYIYTQEYTTSDSTDFALQVDAEMGAVTGVGGGSVSNQLATTGYEYWNGQEMVERSGCSI